MIAHGLNHPRIGPGTFDAHLIASGDDVGQIYRLLGRELPIDHADETFRRIGNDGTAARRSRGQVEVAVGVQGDGRRHGGARPFACRGMIGHQGARSIARRLGKVGQLVVEEHPFGHARRAKNTRHGGRHGDGVAGLIDNDKMCRAGVLDGGVSAQSGDFFGLGICRCIARCKGPGVAVIDALGGSCRDQARSLREVFGVEHAFDGHGQRRIVGDKMIAIRIGQALYFGKGGPVGEPIVAGEFQGLQHAQNHTHGNPRGRRRRATDAQRTVGDTQRPMLSRTVGRDILGGQ